MAERIKVANAPVSYGVFELTVGARSGLPGPQEVLDAVAGAGYDGIDLGPHGWLGTSSELRSNLDDHSLGLAGGWVELRLLEEDALEQDLEALSEVIESFKAAPGGNFAPKPTLADAGSEGRRAAPGHAALEHYPPLSQGDWTRLVSGLERAARACRDAGLEPTFHHHAGTFVETVAEIERLLEDTDVGLCLDTGHLVVGGGNPLAALESWRERVNHVHIKDVDGSMLRTYVDRRASMEEIWAAGVFPELGAGDVDVSGFVAALIAGGYEGWVVVEQDRVLRAGQPFGPIVEEQERNLATLRAMGLQSQRT